MRRGARVLGGSALFGSLLLVLLAGPARGADFTVTNLNDAGAGSLRQALTDAEDSTDPDRVLFAPALTGTITLTSGELNIPDQTEIIGPGADRLTVSGGGTVRVFHAGGGANTYSISGLTIANGTASAGGGGITSAGTATLSGLVVRNNSAGGAGGGIAHLGDLTMRDSTISANTVTAVGGGGGISVTMGALTIERSTITGNSATMSVGGGVNHGTAGGEPLTITDSTVAGNTASTSGGGVFFDSLARLTNTIVGDNSAPSRPDIDGGGVSPDARATFSLIEQLGGAPVAVDASDLTGVDPRLASLAANGGTTPTMALLPNSPALDKGSSGAGADQRGFPRPFDLAGIPLASGGNSADIGAYERVLCGKLLATRVGTAGPDRISGTPGADGILGLGGKDKLKGLKGKDSLCGGPGKDKLRGGAGKDSLFGQGGRDLLVGGKGKDKLKGGAGKDKVRQ
jgi:Ca2+-binding RTX toxin-like protein